MTTNYENQGDPRASEKSKNPPVTDSRLREMHEVTDRRNSWLKRGLLMVMGLAALGLIIGFIFDRVTNG